MICFTIIYIALCLIPLIFGNENKTLNKFTINIDYSTNNTFILYYNLTTNYSYYITFRLFEYEQIKFGLFSPTYFYKQKSIKIFNPYNTSPEIFYLFIICFHFIQKLNDIDIQCKDIRLLKLNQIKSHTDFLPSYKPLFVPLMYLLSVLMLLPVIIQHRRRKQAQIIERRKQLRRLSLTIAQDNPSILSKIVQNENINFRKIPIQIELVSLPSTQTVLDNIDDNDNITFTLQKLESFRDKYENNYEESGFTADDCIAHLLNNTPWNTSSIQQPPLISSSLLGIIKEQQDNPRKTTFYGTDEDEQQSMFKSNPIFVESDV